MHVVEERLHYEPGSGVSLLRLPLLLVGAFAAAAGLAWALSFAYLHHWYLIMLLALVAGGILGGVVYVLVGLTHCRNPWLAGGVGIAAGIATYLGYFQLCLEQQFPLGPGWHFELLPRYIQVRMETDVAEDVAAPNRAQGRQAFAPLNWAMFAAEMGFIAGIAAACGWNRARRAYVAELGQWMRRETALLPANAGPAFRQALETGRLADFVAATPAATDMQMSAQLILEYAQPADGSPLSYPIYATMEDFPQVRPWYRPRALRSALLRQVELEPDEVLALRPRFPELTRLLENTHAELREERDELVHAVVAGAPVSEVAEIVPVPEPFRQRVRGPGYALKVNLRGLIPLIYFLGGAGVAGLGIWLILEGLLVPGCAALVVGAAAFAWGFYIAIYCLAVYENRWIEGRLRAEIGHRSDAWVGADDPDSSYVSLIPRESFVKVKWTMASDVLLLRLDERRRQLLLEGDTDRYRIPAGAISLCEPQCFFHPIDVQRQNELWMVRLLVRVPEGMRELLLGIGHTRFTPMTNARRRAIVKRMCTRINQLAGVAEIS